MPNEGSEYCLFVTNVTRGNSDISFPMHIVDQHKAMSMFLSSTSGSRSLQTFYCEIR